MAVLLAALVLAGPLARFLGVAAVLGYLLAGVLLGPYGVGRMFTAHDASEILHFAEFGVILLLFLIGLELRPRRVYAMRQAVFGLGALQVSLSAFVLGLAALALGFPWQAALFAGAALALSSTPLALQVLEENGELTQRHGRLAFAVLLFQDMAAIPLIALAPYFAVSAADAAANFNVQAFAISIGTILAVIAVGYYVLDHVIRFVAMSKVREAMTAVALLTVVGVSVVMQSVGLSASLGAFLAGVLLAESSYRHQLQADLEPIEGLLLGIFFTAIGMSLNLGLLLEQPGLILAMTAGLMLIKGTILYALAYREELRGAQARRFALALAHSGEFAFVLLTAGSAAGVLGKGPAELLAVVVTLSIGLTPVLLLIERALFGKATTVQTAFDTLPENDAHVVIAGFGRFGQIAARVLRAKGIPFTALDISAEQIEFVRKFGAKAFYGDASRLDILEAAQTGKASAFVLAIDDIEASMRAAELVKTHFPDVPIYARARNRNHAHRLLDLGVKSLQRETFLSALQLTRDLLGGLGLTDRAADRAIARFKEHDERRLIDDYKDASDMVKLQERARADALNLEKLFLEDAEEDARAEEEAKAQAKAQTKAASKPPVKAPV